MAGCELQAGSRPHTEQSLRSVAPRPRTVAPALALPHELMLSGVFPWLSARALATCCAVNRSWQAGSCEPSLWEALCMAHRIPVQLGDEDNVFMSPSFKRGYVKATWVSARAAGGAPTDSGSVWAASAWVAASCAPLPPLWATAARRAKPWRTAAAGERAVQLQPTMDLVCLH